VIHVTWSPFGSSRGVNHATCSRSSFSLRRRTFAGASPLLRGAVTRIIDARYVHTDETLAVAVVVLALSVYVAAMATFHVVLIRRRREPKARPSADRPLVSILKPLAGADDDLFGNLDSFAALEGWPYEVVFGVASRSDAAYAAACAFLARHPDVAGRVVVTDPHAAINPKIAQLIGLAKKARGAVLVVSDSNVRVPPHYLDDLVGRLEDPACGLVTSVFVGTGERTIGGALENLQLASTATPVVVLSTCGARPVTVGKSMAMRRVDLERLGGFAAFGGFLAEDHVMGRRFADAGLRVATSFVPVENRNVDATVARTFERHSRWAKLRRALAPTLFTLEPFLVPIIVATVATLLVPSRVTVAALGIAIVVQTFGAHVAVRAARGSWLPFRYAPLEIVRSVVVVGCWFAAWWSMTVTWRGNRLVIGPDSSLERWRSTRPSSDRPTA